MAVKTKWTFIILHWRKTQEDNDHYLTWRFKACCKTHQRITMSSHACKKFPYCTQHTSALEVNTACRYTTSQAREKTSTSQRLNNSTGDCLFCYLVSVMSKWTNQYEIWSRFPWQWKLNRPSRNLTPDWCAVRMSSHNQTGTTSCWDQQPE